MTGPIDLVPQTKEQTLAHLDALPPEWRDAVSPAYRAMVEASAAVDPWVHGFSIRLRGTDVIVGKVGFKGPPDADGIVEIAYVVEDDHQNRGYASAAARAITHFAFEDPRVTLVRAHTLVAPNASHRVLVKSGFRALGEVVDPEDGPVWRWEISRGAPA